jgi:hypothetical protein
MEKSQDTVSGDWEKSLQPWIDLPHESIQAVSFLKGWRKKSNPVLLQCSDGERYVVKGIHSGRQIVNDQIVAHLGRLLDAPVGVPRLIDVSSELIDLDSNLSAFSPGLAHGTLWIPGCFDAYELLGTGEAENKLRYALLAILYSWVINSDRQFLFNNNPPRLVHSVDHGHCFAGGPDWTIASLRENLEPKIADGFEACHFKSAEFQHMLSALTNISKENIFSVVGSLPGEWGITMGEREILVEYLLVRQQRLLSVLPSSLSETR